MGILVGLGVFGLEVVAGDLVGFLVGRGMSQVTGDFDGQNVGVWQITGVLVGQRVGSNLIRGVNGVRVILGADVG